MKRLLKYTLAALAAILVLPTAFLCGLYLTADMEQPAVTTASQTTAATPYATAVSCAATPTDSGSSTPPGRPKSRGRRQAPSPQG